MSVPRMVNSVLFPDPETPVMQVKVPSGKLAVTPRRLFPVALTTFSFFPFPLRRSAGTATARSPRRYCPVIEFGAAAISSGVPRAMISPPSIARQTSSMSTSRAPRP